MLKPFDIVLLVSLIGLEDAIRATRPYVWPYLDGVEVGPSVEPLDPCVPHVAARHAIFYRIMALVEACRVGRSANANWPKTSSAGS